MLKQTIVVFSYQDTGHIHPISCIVRALVECNKARVICYGTNDTKSIIDKTGAEYRPYSDNKDEFQLFKNPTSGKFINKTIHDCKGNIKKLAQTIQDERPNLIFYDELCLVAKYTLLYLKNKRKRDRQVFVPLLIMFRSTIVRENSALLDMVTPGELLSAVIPQLKLIRFNMRFGFCAFDFHKFSFCTEEELNIVSVFPDLQPNLHLYANTNRFVGCCMKDELRLTKALDAPLKSMLDSFPPINPMRSEELDSIRSSAQFKLILVSFGTIHNVHYEPYLKVLKAFKLLQADAGDKFKVIVSASETIIGKLQEKLSVKELVKPENIVLTTFVPQLDVLKRASLFVTHCGLNSTCKAIFYGVPLICIPMYSDQFIVARRVADELRVGKRINKGKLTPNKVARAINEISSDKSYNERIIELSKIHRQYDGPANAAKEIFNALDKSTIGKVEVT